MGLSAGMSLSISRSFYNVFIYVIVACCYLCLMNASFPTTAATSRLGGNETDRLALLAFKAKITNDPFKVMSSWNGSIHFCQWRGVTCGRRHKRVTKLDLSFQKLFGSISPHIGNLSFVRVVNLQDNSFENEIPPEVGHLRKLQYLGLNNNSISGSIPVNLSGCTNLVEFYSYYNKLVGAIPNELGSLSKLKFVAIWHNNLIGNIPHSFMNLSSLEVLDASENNFSGSVPEALGQLTKLTFISLGDNMLSGTIPPSIFNLSTLTAFSVIKNRITGTLPSNIGITLPSLQHLGLSGNQFTGSIPISISNATNLELFQIGKNNLNGKVPTMERLHKFKVVIINQNHLGSGGVGDLSFISSLTNATNLRVLAIDENNFGGMLPQSIGNLSTKLEVFVVSDNHIFGSIPVAIGNLINLNWLNMGGNQFTGNIPTQIGKLQKLNRLSLNANNFSGFIPSSLGNLSVLIELYVNANNLQGSVPSSLAKCQNLLLLNLSKNKLNGTIPLHVFNILSLSLFLDLSQNHFTGSLPVEVGNLKNLGGLYVHENMLSGEIPSTIGSCVSLEYLNMESNFFQGSIPSSLSNLKAIQELDLSRNNFTGKIPEYFKSFQFLQYLNLSYNDFDGMVPIKGVFGNASAISIMGNSKLCGGIPELQLPRCNLVDPEKSGSTTLSFKMVIAIASGLLVVTLVFSALYVCWCRKRREKPSTEDSGSLFLRVSYQSLYRATTGFSESNLIGVGSFGVVYEGIFDGKKIAVKVLNLLHRGASRSFITECEALRNIRHRNLVKILSACSSVDFQNNDFKALVYEFMVNGSLDDWLHPIGGQGEVPKDLSLVQRLRIAIDVACALDYLHHHCQTPIVHCDLKPSNVLLDDDMTVHVGDFGISRFLLDANQNISENQTSSIGIRGSVGYIPPEYGMGIGVSTSGDVYSYGILLLEMFTGKRPTDEMFDDGMNLHNYARMALPDRVVTIADSVLLQHEEKGENFHQIQECLASIFRIGIACSAESPVERLDMSDVVIKLQVNMDNLLGTRHGRRIANPIQS
ncbi:probable LRR receptor-like serine/threonine-protein kinase At3g47570 [Cornus florida]|uniref:probable LRR receptor-like serine/threonine-protein kinase At3g47570 n=1 Tax=Cornus florida TaxID=4283 RepID=UPI0028968CE6|nr:probable LRR receptor-like serine/threonine-protein kinase At3g47570 [Cornus florida]